MADWPALSISLSIDLVALGFNDTSYSGCTMLGCPTGQNKALHDQRTTFCNVCMIGDYHILLFKKLQWNIRKKSTN